MHKRQRLCTQVGQLGGRGRGSRGEAHGAEEVLGGDRGADDISVGGGRRLLCCREEVAAQERLHGLLVEQLSVPAVGDVVRVQHAAFWAEGAPLKSECHEEGLGASHAATASLPHSNSASSSQRSWTAADQSMTDVANSKEIALVANPFTHGLQYELTSR